MLIYIIVIVKPNFMRNIGIILFFACILLSCKHSSDIVDCRVLNANLRNGSSSLDDVFERVEVVPLETTDSSLVVYPLEMKEYKDILYLFDIHTGNLLSFNAQGKFIRKIGGKGHGPGEYTHLASISIDEKNGILRLLEPWGSCLNYTLEGKFIEKIIFPSSIPNYQTIYHIDGYIITWTIPFNSKSDCISIIDSHTTQLTNSFCNGPRIVKDFSDNFYEYDDKVYYGQTIENHNVYEVTKDSLRLVYRWDFGKDNYDMYDLDFTYTDDNEVFESEKFRKAIKDGVIPYWASYQNENEDYCFVNLSMQQGKGKSVFYNKSKNVSFVFDGTESGYWMKNPRIMTDDYLICVLFNEDLDKYKEVLPDREQKKLDALTEDDNPCLLKLYFKK